MRCQISFIHRHDIEVIQKMLWQKFLTLFGEISGWYRKKQKVKTNYLFDPIRNRADFFPLKLIYHYTKKGSFH